MRAVDMWLPWSKGHAERGFLIGLLFLFQPLVAPFVSVASLFLIMDLYDVPVAVPYRALAAVTFALAFFVFREADALSHPIVNGLAARAGHTLLAWLVLTGMLLFIGYGTKSSADFSRLVLFTWFIATPPAILATQIAFERLQLLTMRAVRNPRKTVIVGVNDLSCRLAEQFIEYPHLDADFCGFFEDRDLSRTGPINYGRIIGRISDLPDYVRSRHIDMIFVALPIAPEARMKQLLDDLHDSTVSIYFVPDIFVFDLIQARLDDINGIPVVALCETPFVGISGFTKRITDLTVGTFVLLVTLPFMLLIAAVIKLTSNGPVLFKQRRYGLDGEEFEVYKFRTMSVTEDGDDIRQATENDPRVTRFGAFLRRYSLDELPQVVNVLQGRMSLVGPRPHAVAHNEMYRKLIKSYMLRHKGVPGITGLAQINGFRGETETVDLMRARLELDLQYLRNWSLGLDFKIMLKTIVAVIVGKRAY